MKIIKILFVPLLIAIGSVLNCKNAASMDDITPPITLEQLEISQGDISNWNSEDSMSIYVGDELYGLIDGGAVFYLDKGLIKTGYQRFKGPDDGAVESYVFNYGSDTNATTMFEEKKKTTTDLVNDPVYPDSIVIVTAILGGVNGSAHFGSFYLELNITGYYDQALALNTLDLFLGFYENKINAQ